MKNGFVVHIAVALAVCAATARAQQTPPPETPPQPPPSIDLGLKVELEPKAMEILKAMCEKLSAAKTLRFDAIAFYESPARTGQPLAYATLSHVTLERPNKLRVITPADGTPQEFYYDGKQIMAFSPEEDMVAEEEAPPTIEAALKMAFDKAAIYFPFTDLVLSDPCKDIEEGLKLAFVVGQSKVVGGITTDVIALANEDIQAQVWIGAEDKLPRLYRATFFNEPGNFRHGVEFTNWALNQPVAADAFGSPRAASAKRIPFEAPMPQPLPPSPTQEKQP
jgi:hypothetical protein